MSSGDAASPPPHVLATMRVADARDERQDAVVRPCSLVGRGCDLTRKSRVRSRQLERLGWFRRSRPQVGPSAAPLGHEPVGPGEQAPAGANERALPTGGRESSAYWRAGRFRLAGVARVELVRVDETEPVLLAIRLRRPARAVRPPRSAERRDRRSCPEKTQIEFACAGPSDQLRSGHLTRERSPDTQRHANAATTNTVAINRFPYRSSPSVVLASGLKSDDIWRLRPPKRPSGWMRANRSGSRCPQGCRLGAEICRCSEPPDAIIDVGARCRTRAGLFRKTEAPPNPCPAETEAAGPRDHERPSGWRMGASRLNPHTAQ